METTVRFAALVAVLCAGAAMASSVASQPQGAQPNPWSGCCGVGPWPQGRGMMGPQGGMMGSQGRGMMMGPQGGGAAGPGSAAMARNRTAMMGGVPAPYTNLSNPLPKTRATVEQGATVYASDCAACHGQTGLGDGPVGRTLSPPPANLAWLSTMPMSHWDPLMYWTIAEGGAPVGSAMPAFKDKLSASDTWAVIAYIQARLPPR